MKEITDDKKIIPFLQAKRDFFSYLIPDHLMNLKGINTMKKYFFHLLIVLFVVFSFSCTKNQKPQQTLIITSDFGSVRRCSTLKELQNVINTMSSAKPDIMTLDAAAPDLVNFHNSVGLFIKGSPFDALFEQGYDPYGIMVDSLRKRDIKVLANIRMNDHHGKVVYWTPWEREHVQWSLGKDTGARDWKAIGRLRHMDYAIQGVRDYRFSILKEIVGRYNVDGLQLDFGRTVPFLSEPKKENAKFLTAYLERIRTLLDDTAQKNNSTRKLLGVLVPWDYQFCVNEGLDVKTWVDQGLVDYISPGEWYYADWNIPLKEWKNLTDGTNCALYPFTPGNVSPQWDFECGEPSLLGNNYVLTPEKIRAIADNFMNQQPDGFAFYNFYTFDYGEYYPHLREWTDPQKNFIIEKTLF